MEMSSQHAKAPYYFVPGPSQWPVLAGISMLVTMAGASAWVNGHSWGMALNIIGILAVLVVLYKWFGQAIGESESGQYSERIDASFRWGMGWFIFSEVMFFAAFFGALFYTRVLSVPDLASFDNLKLLYPHFSGVWPSAGPAFKEKFTPMAAFGLPALTTLLLLSSGATITW